MDKRIRDNVIIEDIRQSLEQTMPRGSGRVILFGSQARGTAKEKSDWDILVILNKDVLEPSDYDRITFPFGGICRPVFPFYCFRMGFRRKYFSCNVYRKGMGI